jgi:hypothetical protein
MPVAKKTVAKKAPAKKTVAKKTVVKKEPAKKTVAKKAPAKKAAPKAKKVDFTGMTPRQVADAKGEPWVSVISVELDPDNIGNGAFELDWNDKFITNLVRQGYKGKTDADMVDQWFQDVCRNVVQENFEQWEANQPVGERPREIQRRDLGDGRTEVS